MLAACQDLSLLELCWNLVWNREEPMSRSLLMRAILRIEEALLEFRQVCAFVTTCADSCAS